MGSRNLHFQEHIQNNSRDKIFNWIIGKVVKIPNSKNYVFSSVLKCRELALHWSKYEQNLSHEVTNSESVSYFQSVRVPIAQKLWNDLEIYRFLKELLKDWQSLKLFLKISITACWNASVPGCFKWITVSSNRKKSLMCVNCK